MGRITELLNAAHIQSQAQGWPYIGALLPHEAHELLQLAPGAQLIDVRSRAELELTGALPGAVHV
ncbi:MAG: rhodanese-like domain-containing protein, partial [Gammaproteobacteria bacterium]|nr:rhodanese-like domain-containing protein [Gammaproteobacteria bacterium]